jgi:hypothetical protein
MNPLQARHPSAAPAVSTTVSATINPDQTQPTPDVRRSGKLTGRTGQLSAFDRLIWGSGQEPVIEG